MPPVRNYQNRQRSRAWCFTLNNYTEVEQTALHVLECTYLVVGREMGENGTPHLQGYIVFANAVAFASVKRLLGDRGHIEKADGNAKQNREYCTKEGDYFESGIMPEQGKRKDIDRVRELVQAGESLSTIADQVGNCLTLFQCFLMYLPFYAGIVLPGTSIRGEVQSDQGAPKIMRAYGLLVLRPYGHWKEPHCGSEGW